MVSNPIDNAIIEIKHLIPEEVLFEAFKDTVKRLNCTVEHAIEEDVIRTRVLKDCNLFAGRIVQFELLEEYLLPFNTPAGMEYNTGTFLNSPNSLPANILASSIFKISLV